MFLSRQWQYHNQLIDGNQTKLLKTIAWLLEASRWSAQYLGIVYRNRMNIIYLSRNFGMGDLHNTTRWWEPEYSEFFSHGSFLTWVQEKILLTRSTGVKRIVWAIYNTYQFNQKRASHLDRWGKLHTRGPIKEKKQLELHSMGNLRHYPDDSARRNFTAWNKTRKTE